MYIAQGFLAGPRMSSGLLTRLLIICLGNDVYVASAVSSQWTYLSQGYRLWQALLLHGEQYLELKGHIPVSGELVSTPKLLDIKDKGKAAVVVSEINTRDRSTGALIAVSETTTFIRKAGGFGTTPSVK